MVCLACDRTKVLHWCARSGRNWILRTQPVFPSIRPLLHAHHLAVSTPSSHVETDSPGCGKYYVPHDSVNETNEQTVLLIHGARIRTMYHLLIPDLPSHGAAQRLKPFSKDHVKAHIVGWSLSCIAASYSRQLGGGDNRIQETSTNPVHALLTIHTLDRTTYREHDAAICGTLANRRRRARVSGHKAHGRGAEPTDLRW